MNFTIEWGSKMREIKMLGETRAKLWMQVGERAGHTHLRFYDGTGQELFYLQFSEVIVALFGPSEPYEGEKNEDLEVLTAYERPSP